MVEIPTHLSDDALVAAMPRLAAGERAAIATLVAHLVEMDRRQLAVAAGYSLFTYCCGVLLLSEDAACNRTTAVRVVRRFPAAGVLAMLADGRLTLSTLRVLAPHLTEENHSRLLSGAFHKSKRTVEELVARRFPQPVATSIRKMPAPEHTPSRAPAAPAVAAPASTEARVDANNGGRPSIVARRPLVPMAEDVFLIRLAAKRAMVERLRRAQDLLAHAVPRGDVTEVFDRALVALIADLEKKKFARRPQRAASRIERKGARPGTDHTRTIPAEVRRAVSARDGDRCAFVSPAGRRCEARAYLEFHHLRPYATGGEADAANIALRCHAHNQYEADRYFTPIRAAMSSRDATRPGADEFAVGAT